MKLAFLYAGQGSQHAGMGKDLYDCYPAFRRVFDSVSLDFDLKSVCFDDPDGVINETQYTQPCMVAFAAGVTAILQENKIQPSYAAGLSLGEYSALQAAGVWDAATAIRLTAFRGKAMATAVQGRSCGMTAVLGLDRTALAECCRKASAFGVVEICNYNCPGQLVIGGDADAVTKAGELAKETGAKRCLPLKVSGPFHTSLMKPAGDALCREFTHIAFGEPVFPVVFNCLGAPRDGQSIPELLEKQVQSSVYMEDSLHWLAEHGVDTIVEIGPGKTLSGFMKKTAGNNITCLPVEDVPSLKNALGILKGEHHE